jgi:hypothetical protein
VHSIQERSGLNCFSRLNIIDIAVVYNLMGIQLGDRGRFLLQEAHRCYIRAQLLVPDQIPQRDVIRLLLSAQNNLISVYHEFGMHQEGKACRVILAQILPRSLELMVDEARGLFHREILLNLMVFSKRDRAAAA